MHYIYSNMKKIQYPRTQHIVGTIWEEYRYNAYITKFYEIKSVIKIKI